MPVRDRVNILENDFEIFKSEMNGLGGLGPRRRGMVTPLMDMPPAGFGGGFGGGYAGLGGMGSRMGGRSGGGFGGVRPRGGAQYPVMPGEDDGMFGDGFEDDDLMGDFGADQRMRGPRLRGGRGPFNLRRGMGGGRLGAGLMRPMGAGGRPRLGRDPLFGGMRRDGRVVPEDDLFEDEVEEEDEGEPPAKGKKAPAPRDSGDEYITGA